MGCRCSQTSGNPHLMMKASIAIVLTLSLGASASNSQSLSKLPLAAQEHIRQLMNELSPNSDLRREFLSGAHGDGVPKPWMADMRHASVKRAVVWVAIDFDRHGKPKRMRIQRTDYFTAYDDASKVLDTKSQTVVRTNGLEQKLVSIALEQAAHGFWIDVPRPKPHPFVGGVGVEFFDDGWIPTGPPVYCAGKSCLPEP